MMDDNELTIADLDEIEAEAERATPGPWLWENLRKREIRLYTPKGGQCTVMDFVRRGMQGAQPRFAVRGIAPLRGGIMHDADNLDLANHPDAAFIAHARQTVPALVRLARSQAVEIERLRGLIDFALDSVRGGWNRTAIEILESALEGGDA